MADHPDIPPPPADGDIEIASRFIEPWRRIVEPRYLGLERIPGSGPMLLVGNHTIYGIQDLPVLMLDLYRERGLKVRGLGDHNHFRMPVWGDLLKRLGGVDGTRRTCAELMQRGEPILVFPGGAREVHKRAGERYELIWKKRFGFARLAIEHGCPIVPFAALGGDDNFEVLVDIDSTVMKPLAAVLERVGGDRAKEIIPPLSAGPRLEPFYFAFGDPIDTTPWAGCHEDQRTLRRVRDQVRRAIEAKLAELAQLRDEEDPPTGVQRLAKAVLPT